MSIRTVAKNLSDNNSLAHKIYHVAHEMKVYMMKNMNDREYAKAYYRDKTGKYLNIDNPQTFDEKLWWLKLNYRNPLETICSDKYRMREYVKNADCNTF